MILFLSLSLSLLEERTLEGIILCAPGDLHNLMGSARWNSKSPLAACTIRFTGFVRCRWCLPSIEGNSSTIVQKKKSSNVTSIESSERIWTTYNQSALHSYERSETPHGLQSSSTAVWVPGKALRRYIVRIGVPFPTFPFEAFKYFNSFPYLYFI